ncbi:L,D-transpeptidase family protein [Novosphingobium sp.]|uniref:L,D-transpeptidase family protein n=1 Tax=Novosphingobium sp. TaxID=1874826 RepID=UPI001EBEB79F|nr:L,D-transpeptidase family protein [Novosphingobium sp.]MBK6802127.1 L,D-transpeptidase family protein [Novosphingobium sp.]MBK9009817.1 L,D-transpeptidase family protein [Novosphingobium sp.]
MGLKLNAATGLMGAFVVLVGAAGWLMVQNTQPEARILPAADPATTQAKAPPPKPRDERFVIKRILPITGPIRYGEWHWDEKDVPAGPTVITVDLDARVLSVFRGGYEIGATAVLLGTSEKPTPLGVFPIKWKKADHYSRTYDLAPMPFTQNLTDDGVAIHGTKVEKGYASHGCVGVPNDFAKKLFAVTQTGDKVYITRGKRVGKGDSLVEG